VETGVSLYGNLEGNLEGGLLYWRPRRISNGRFWKLPSVLRGPVGGGGEGPILLGTLRERLDIVLSG